MHAIAPPVSVIPEGAWNPGISSEIPTELLHLATIYCPENTFTNLRELRELAGISGLPMDELVVFRPERLVVHELLARVTADYTVEDGERSEDLGINFRRMCDTVLARHIAPRMPHIVAEYDAMRERLQGVIAAELATVAQTAARPTASKTQRGIWSWFKPRPPNTVAADIGSAAVLKATRDWELRAADNTDPLNSAAWQALARVAGSMLARHGRLWGDASIVVTVATGLACNDYGAELIGQLIEPLLRDGARAEGFRPLPVQSQPVVMNTKGASAAGKSTLRPLQRKLAERIGVSWEDFALVSPDIFRKFLLDYGTLGDAYKYAGAFTGHELQVVDRKLDRYMASKAARGAMSHLLIDRFRFDTFAPASEVAGSNLLTRFGHRVYMFYVITPPDATVERAWARGLEVGRYKAVDDLLAHNIEAYRGMPEVFFTWALSADKQVHYEFLDNSVAQGSRPRTVAFGWNGEMNVLSVKGLIDAERYRKINVDAREPRAVYPGTLEMAPERNTAFLEQCVHRLPAINFADRETGRVYLRIENGEPAWCEEALLAAALADPDARAGVTAVAPKVISKAAVASKSGQTLKSMMGAERLQTLGDWGEISRRHG